MIASQNVIAEWSGMSFCYRFDRTHPHALECPQSVRLLNSNFPLNLSTLNQ